MEGFVVTLLGLVVFLVFLGVKSVPQGKQYTVQRFGKFTRALSPGLHFIIPFVDKVAHKVNMKEQVLDVPPQEVITRDNATVMADGVVFYQVLDAGKASYEVNDLERAVVNLAMTNIRSVLGSMDLDELLSNRDAINTRLLSVIDDATDPWGVKVTRVEIRDITPPADLVESMGRQMKAERDRRANILEAEGHKRAAVLRAEGEKAAVMLEAEGRKEAAFRDAEAREREAQAEAEATRRVSEAVANGDVQALNYFVAQKYIEALQAIASAENEKLVFMPLEAGSVIGAVGGISELVQKNIDFNAGKGGK